MREMRSKPAQKLRLTIFAATGGIGREIVTQGVTAGHDITAVIRNPSKLSATVQSVTADLANADPAALEPLRAEQTQYFRAWCHVSSEAGVAWRGTRAIVQAMKAVKVRRIVVVSAAPIGTVRVTGSPNPPKHDPGGRILHANST
jgi:putative NADH-flavin reductase